MYKRILLLMILAIAGIVPLSAQTNAFNGICFNGGKSAVVNGLQSSNKLDQIIPSCTITVYLTGTTTLAPAIYKDAINTPLSNPFTADSLVAVAPGKWLFFAANGIGYDVVMSGGIAPLTYSTPVTLTDLRNGGGGGGSGVTSFSAGNLPPLFTTTVTNPGTTPNLGFNLSNAAANTIFGNFTGTSGPPFFAVFTCTGLLTCSYDSGSNIWNVNIPSTSTLSITTTNPIKVNSGNGPVSSGTANISCDPAFCQPSNLAMVPPNPLGTQNAVIYPTGFTISNVPGGISPYVTNTGGVSVAVPQCAGSESTTITWTYTGALAAQAPWIHPANVTAVYGFIYASSSAIGSAHCAPVLAGPNYGSVFGTVAGSGIFTNLTAFPTTLYTAATSLTGFTLEGTTSTAGISLSGATNLTIGNNFPLVGLVVYDSIDTAPPPSGAIEVAPPLEISNATGSEVLSIAGIFPQYLNVLQSVTGLPAAATHQQRLYVAPDTNDCQNTGGSGRLCIAALVSNTWVWVPFLSGTGDTITSPGSTLTVGGTSTNTTLDFNLAHANTWTAKQTQPAPLLSNLAGGGTQCLNVDNTGQVAGTGVACGAGGGSIPNTTQILAGDGSGNAVATHMDDGQTTASTITSTEPINVAASGPAQIGMTYNATPVVPGSSTTAVFGVNSSGQGVMSEAGGTAARICDATNGICAGGTHQWSCQSGLGDGLNVISTGTYPQTSCQNTTGSTVTLTGLSCFTDNNGTSSMNASGHTLGALLTGAVTCSSSFAAGTQSANVLLTNGDYIAFSFVADGSTKQTTWVVKGTY